MTLRNDFFVTGTDTGVGKTVCSACLLLALTRQKINAGYMKPVQTGCIQKDARLLAPDVDYITNVQQKHADNALYDLICPYRFSLAASPHLAARHANETIQLKSILGAFKQFQQHYESIIVEGAGGILVPLNSDHTMLHLMCELKIPIVLACRAGLGTLNHTLLSVQRLQSANLTCAGLIIVCTSSDPWGLIEEDNKKTLEDMTSLPVLGVLPYDSDTANGKVNLPFLKQMAETLTLPPLLTSTDLD